MDFDGKRQDRMRFPSQVSMDPELGSEIRRRAARRRRNPGQQIVYLLTVGILHDPEEWSNERGVNRAHDNSRPLTDSVNGDKVDTHFRARPRTASHKQSREKSA